MHRYDAALTLVEQTAEQNGRLLASNPNFNQATLLQRLDGLTAYIGTSIAGQTSNGYSYLYSVPTGGSAVALASLALNPATVKGGTSSRGTVTLSGPAPAGGVVVTLASGTAAMAQVPRTLTIPAGAESRTFTVKTKHVSANSTVIISASYAGVLRKAAVTVTP
jgi:hypothetical protein